MKSLRTLKLTFKKINYFIKILYLNINNKKLKYYNYILNNCFLIIFKMSELTIFSLN
jgi:hypothetical protein